MHNALGNKSLKLGYKSLNETCTRQYSNTAMQKYHMAKITQFIGDIAAKYMTLERYNNISSRNEGEQALNP